MPGNALNNLRALFDATYDVVAGLNDARVEWRPEADARSAGELVAAIAASRERHVCLLRREAVRTPDAELPPRAGYNFVRRLAERSATEALRRLDGVDLAGEANAALVRSLVEAEVALREELARYPEAWRRSRLA